MSVMKYKDVFLCLCHSVSLDVDLFNDSFFLISVMDVTDIINGKVDDEDKQHFIPFQS